MIECPVCQSNRIRQASGKENGKIQYQCRDCHEKNEGGGYFSKAYEGAKILVFDIETSPIKAYVWRAWKQNVYMDQIIDDWFMLTWSAKWLNHPEMLSEAITPKEAKNHDDKRIVKKLWKLFNEADILIAHHGRKFDIPKSKQRFVLNGLKPNSPYQIIDTKELAKREFDFTHNKLDYIAQIFGMKRKKPTDFQLWVDCMKGDKKALDYMLKYNEEDVLILEEVYLGLRGWMKSHPNLGLYTLDEESMCPTCGDKKLKWIGEYYTQLNRYDSYQCGSCGSINKSKQSNLTTNKKKYLLKSNAR